MGLLYTVLFSPMQVEPEIKELSRSLHRSIGHQVDINILYIFIKIKKIKIKTKSTLIIYIIYIIMRKLNLFFHKRVQNLAIFT